MLGYCVFPLAVASVFIKLISLFGLKKGLVAFIVDFVIVTLAFVWAMFGESSVEISLCLFDYCTLSMFSMLLFYRRMNKMNL